MGILLAAFLAFSLPPYLTFDPSQSRLPVREGVAIHYPALVAHILFGTVALIACCLQVWPWFRQRYPVAHRRIGRVYVFGGVLPSALLAIPTSILGHTGVSGAAGNVLLSVLWLTTTFAGFRMARQRRYAEHRRWMIRSFALATSIVLNRLWGILAMIVVPMLPAADDAERALQLDQAFAATVWLSWVVNLLIAEWWLERTRTPKRRARQAPPATAEVPVQV